MSGEDPDVVAMRRRARRIARELHPDRGGDPATYVEAMATLASLVGPEQDGQGRGVRVHAADVEVRQRRWGTLRGLARRRWRAWRRHRRRRQGSGWTQL